MWTGWISVGNQVVRQDRGARYDLLGWLRVIDK
jgi:hypothetical protein